MKLTPATYIDTAAALRALAPQLAQQPFLSIDTESNSLYAYREQVCLFQISTRTADYIIDPLAIDDMEPLGALLADERIEKILHAAEYDIMGIKRDFGFAINNIFDTMLAARICGHRQVGLNSMLKQYAGIELDKKHQRDNWGKRPLPAVNLQYAQMDTHFLGMLRNDLYDELAQQGRLAEARDLFEELRYIEPPDTSFDPDGYWHIGKPKGLNRQQMAILREVYLWREAVAERRDVPPFKVITNDTMVAIARRAPANRDELAEIRGLSTALLRRYGDALLKLIDEGSRAKLPSPPRRPQPAPPKIMERFSALREWRKMRAEARGVESDVIISKTAMWALATEAPRSLDDLESIPGIGPWRLSAYGSELLAVLQKTR